jgi:hypothetical protein
MASDDPKLPRVTLRDEKLYVEGENEPYFRDGEHTIRLRIRELTIRRGYQPDYSNPAAPKVLAERLSGMADLEKSDRLAVVGLKTKSTVPIEFDLSPVSDTETRYHWQAFIWFRPNEWEFAWKEAFCVNGHCTRQYFDDLLAAVRRCHVDNIQVDIQTALWTRDESTWHVAPPNYHEYGNTISSLIWEERFGLQPVREVHELTRSKEADDELKPQLIELPARLYSILNALLAIAAALLMLTFLRH